MPKFKHLTLTERKAIENCLNDSLSFKAIAKDLGTDCTSISKEVRKHITQKKTGRTAEHLIIVYIDLTVLIPISVTAVIAEIVIAVFALNVTWCVLTMRNICVLCFQNHLMYVMAAKILKAVHLKNLSMLQKMLIKSINYYSLNHEMESLLMRKRFYGLITS